MFTDPSSLIHASQLDCSFAPMSIRNPHCAEIKADFTERCYLWTGNINPDIYAEDCVFTDPTLTFKGLSTYQRNLASLQPLVDRLVAKGDIELLSCTLHLEEKCVVAEWRMNGTFTFPWKPCLDLHGCTKFRFDSAAGNRIVRYDETWNMPAFAALMQLLRPCKVSKATSSYLSDWPSRDP
jgi:hypothetical protein